ncbi:TPA: hypothetical protein ACKPXC_000473 [Pseudomonas aeruginosa]
MNKANECTCPSGDGSLVHPCPAHPAVEQAGGDERAAFELFVRKHCGMPAHIAVNWDAKFTNDAWAGWQARAALAQSSPVQAEQPTADDYEEVLADHRRLVREMDVLLNGEACAAKQAMLCDLVSQVEAEVRKSGQPLLVSAERYRWLRNDDNWGADDSEGQGTSKWANLGELSGTDFDAYLDQLRGSNPVMDIDPEHSKAIAKRGRDAIVAQAEGAPVIGCLCGMPMTEGRHSPGGCTSLEEFAPNPAQAQSEQAEAERPEGSADLLAIVREAVAGSYNEWKMTSEAVTEIMEAHERIVGALRADRDSWAEQAGQRLADWDEMRKERDASLANVDCLAVQVLKLGGTISFDHHRTEQPTYECTMGVGGGDGNLFVHGDHASIKAAQKIVMERDAALAKVAELEGKLTDWVHEGFRLNEALMVVQAQHSVPEGWMLVECGIWTQEQVDEMQKTVTRFRNSEFVDDRALAMAVADAGQCKAPEISLAELLAGAPGTEVPQAWLDVQSERRRQINVEGWTPEHDDEHDSGELAAAGAAYALHAADHLNPYSQGDGGDEAPSCWPWHDGIAGRGEGPEKTEPAWWKPSTPRRDLVKACALALAEIERLDRATATQGGPRDA